MQHIHIKITVGVLVYVAFRDVSKLETNRKADKLRVVCPGGPGGWSCGPPTRLLGSPHLLLGLGRSRRYDDGCAASGDALEASG